MGLTAFSFILLPLCLVWLTSPAKVLKLIPIFGIFEAAAAVNVGSLGVQPGLVPAVTFIGFMLLQMLLGAEFKGRSQVLEAVRPFVTIAVWAMVASFILPYIFQGTVHVWPQKQTPPFVLKDLAPDMSGLNQCIYLLMDTLFVVLAATFFRARASAPSFFRFYLFSGFLASAVAVWQLGSKVGGVPYPNDLFYSNPGVAILTDQTMSAVPRINGPFTEPSALAVYMCSIVCSTGWMMLKGHRDAMIRWLFPVGLLTIILSTSTTGFGVLAIVAAGVPVFSLISGSFQMMSRILIILVSLAAIAGVITVAAELFIPDFDDDVQTVISATLGKQQSSSFDERTGADLDSLAVVVDSYGLGAGWGNNRASSLVPGLLAQLGVPGCLGLLWFGFVINGQVRKARQSRCPRDQLMVIDGCCGALVGFLLAAMLSGPTINSITFFYLLALLIATTTKVSHPGTGPRRRLLQDYPGTASGSVEAYSSSRRMSPSSASDNMA